MADSKHEKIFHVDFDGRSHVDVKALLNDPSVKETLQRFSKANQKFRNNPEVTFLKPPAKSEG
jgi:hypothetical protein